MLILAVLALAAIGSGALTGHFGRDGQALRPIHYDTNYDLSARRRASPTEPFTPPEGRP